MQAKIYKPLDCQNHGQWQIQSAQSWNSNALVLWSIKRHTSPNAGRSRHGSQLAAYSATFTDAGALITVIFPWTNITPKPYSGNKIWSSLHYLVTRMFSSLPESSLWESPSEKMVESHPIKTHTKRVKHHYTYKKLVLKKLKDSWDISRIS